MVFENVQSNSSHWIDVQLEGTRSNRNAVGAIVEVRFADQRRFKQVVSRTGFLSQGTYRLHFGIGKADKVDQVIVKWPSQETQIIEDLAVDQLHLIKESPAATK